MAVWNNTQWNIILTMLMPRAIYTKDHNAIVERLKKARFESGLGQVEASKKLGKTQSYLSKIEWKCEGVRADAPTLVGAGRNC